MNRTKEMSLVSPEYGTDRPDSETPARWHCPRTVPQAAAGGESWDWAAVGLAALAAAGVGAFLVWASGRGLDVTDEGSFLVATRNPEEVRAYFSFYYLYGGPVFRVLGYDVAYYRIFGQALLAIASAVFCLGLNRMAASVRGKALAASDSMFILAFCLLGSELYYSWFMRVPSYNLYSSASFLISLGLLLYALANDGPLPATVWAALFGSGVFVFIGTLMKFTTGGLTAVAYALLVLTRAGWAAKTKAAAALALVLGGTVWLAIHCAVLLGPSDTLGVLQRGVAHSTALRTNHGIEMLGEHADQLYYVLTRGVWHFRWAYLVLLAAWAAQALTQDRQRKRDGPVVLIVLATGAVCAILRQHYLGGSAFLDRMTLAWAAWLELLAALVLYCCFRAGVLRAGAWRSQPVWLGAGAALLVLAAPIIGAFGTNNHITQNSLFLMAPWLAALGLLLIALRRLCVNGWIKILGAALAGGLCVSHIYHAGMSSPYRLPGAVSEQCVEVTAGVPPQVLRLDARAARYVNELKALAGEHGFRAGADLLALYSQPGLVFMLGGRAPVVPWITDGYLGFREAQEMVFALAGPERLAKAYILLQQERTTEIQASLAKSGVRFPEQYQLCGRLPCPFTAGYVELWKPAGGPLPKP